MAIVAFFSSAAKPPARFETSTSSTGARGRTAAISVPRVSLLGISFALCTARSTSRARSAFSIAAVNNPFRPWRKFPACECGSSPLVRMIFVSIVSSGHFSCNAFSTIRAWARASSLPRVPITIVLIIPTSVTSVFSRGKLTTYSTVPRRALDFRSLSNL